MQIIYYPVLTLLLFSLAGLVARFGKRIWLPKRREVAVLGGYSIGLLLTWLIVSFVRSVLVVGFSASGHWYDAIIQLIPIFYLESFVMVVALCLQFFQLGGDYNADSEWHLTAKDGARFAIRFLAMATIIFFPIQWLLQPGEYGTFEGSPAETLVCQSVTELFETANAVTNLESIRRIENRASIPHAIAIAAIVAPFCYLIFPLIRFIRRELYQDVAHERQTRSRQAEPSFLRIFNPRGGGRN